MPLTTLHLISPEGGWSRRKLHSCRQVRIFGPRPDALLRPRAQELGFSTVEFSQFATVR
jgi:hypothetical protein